MECREQKPKGPCVFLIARVKQILEHTTKPDRPEGNGKCVKTRKIMDSDESGACTQGSNTTYLSPANTGEVGHGSEV